MTIADATLVIVHGAGHMLQLEQPGALAATLGAWLDGKLGRMTS